MRPQLLLAALTALASASCYSAGDGQAPPLDQLYFPTGLALDSPTPKDDGTSTPPGYLYVASSDFDLQYRSSNLISFDLGAIAAKVPRTCSTSDDCRSGERCDTAEEAANVQDIPPYYVPSYVCVPSDAKQPCTDTGEQSAADRLLYPGRCKAFDQHEFIRSTVGIGAFATDVIFSQALSTEGTPLHSKRLFLPVRGDATLHWIDVDNGLLNCDQGSTSDGSCGSSHRAGHQASANNNNYTQPSEPFGIAASDDGHYVAITNQTSGSVSLYKHDWNSDNNPQLVNVLVGLPAAPVAIAAVPQFLDPNDSAAPSQGFLVAYRNAAQIDLLRVRDDNTDGHPGPNEDFSRYALTYAGSSAITLNSLGYDSRDIVIDPSKRLAACADLASGPPTDYRDCLRLGPQPDVYLANRAPSSLLVGSLTADFSYASGSNDLPAFTDSIQLTTGPSRMVLGNVWVPTTGHATDATHNVSDGKGGFVDLEPRVFVVCFDSTRVFVYDPKRHAIDTIIDTGRGPYAIAVDDGRGLAYVGFFTDSYLGVVSLDQRHRQTYAAVIANIGSPTPPRSSK